MSTQNAPKPIIVPIDLGDRAYDIEIAPDVLDRLGGILKQKFPGARFGVVTDLNVEKNQWARLQKSLDGHGLDYALISIPPGENAKSMAPPRQRGVCAVERKARAQRYCTGLRWRCDW